MTIPKTQLEAFKALEVMEVSFLKAGGWRKGQHGWLHDELSPDVVLTQAQAVSASKQAIVRAQILGGIHNV